MRPEPQLKHPAPSVAAGYVRVSTTDQAREGVSLEAQAERIRSYCLGAGISLGPVFVDVAVSGGTPLAERDQGRALLEAITSKAVGTVVAVKLDRLFRNTVDCLETCQRWDKQRIGLHLIDFNGASINTRTATGRFFLTMAGAFAEMERGLIGERTSAALQHKKAGGARLGGVPFGFNALYPGGPLVPNDSELAAVRVILRLRFSEHDPRSFREIAAHLTSLGYPTRQGAEWQAETVRKIAARSDEYGRALAPTIESVRSASAGTRLVLRG